MTDRNADAEDDRARSAAVDPARSVIVQAPAGSGKTTLLVERYLGLLAVVDAPEEILAITFTRKAAAEMKQRILGYLEPGFCAEKAHEVLALRKARAVEARVAEWGLRENPQRLLIRTIDSFNHYVARTMPVASGLGPVPVPADNTRALYRRAARQVLALVDTSDPLAADLMRLLDWRDHRSQDIEDLLADLLGKRDQWLRAFGVTGTLARRELEAVLHTVVAQQLERSAEVFDRVLRATRIAAADVLELLQHAARRLIANGHVSPLERFAVEARLPAAVPEDLSLWQALGEALLVKDGTHLRRKVDKRLGFLRGTAEKARYLELLSALSFADDSSALADALHRARRLPEPRYSDDEWPVLDALVRVLQRAALELRLVFASTGQTDFSGLAAAALDGLGSEETGFTDLGLYLDRRIQHILVDEYQDTNWGQLHLLEKLTAGWQPAASASQASAVDGRSLFLVGDPMQSIYRFREAEVGLFIRTRDQGIGALRLESRRLTRNFRSRAEIVSWVNERLGPIFPTREDISAGAVAYARSMAARDGGGRVEVIARSSAAAEAAAVADVVERAIAEHAETADFKAAIVVRARSHLQFILPALRARGIAYRAVKLDPLTSRPVVQDLLALTRAVLQPADTVAVLALLRAPFCGLTLADLHTLAGDGRSLQEPDCVQRLHGEARSRAERVFSALDGARAHWRRRPLRELVEGIWQRLGGPACCEHPQIDLSDAAAYLQSLDTADDHGLLDDWNDFLELLHGQFTEGDPPSPGVQLEILTMHGAKGLEWDLVVLPGLNRQPGRTDRELLHWLPFTAAEGGERVLLAPLRSADEGRNRPLVDLIRNEQKTRAAYENERLLYVAATRAREHLVLSAALEPDARGEIKPKPQSLLADLWSTAEDAFIAGLAVLPAGDAAIDGDASGNVKPMTRLPDQTLRRVAADWYPTIESRLHWTPALPPVERQVAVDFNWAGSSARRTGTVLHRLLERVGRVGIEQFDAAERQRLIERIPQLLRSMGGRGDALTTTTEIVRRAFEHTLDSDIGRWLLSDRHDAAACELPIAGLIDGRLVNAIVDRTFIDAAGLRWIVDYKSGYHAGADLEAFFAQESERYRSQLGTYERLFAQLGDRKIRTALYLPRHGRLEVID